MSDSDPELPLVFSRADAVAAGLSEEQVRRRAARTWNRLRRGQFVAGALDDEHRWRAVVLATMRVHERPLVLSHASAARAWGLPSPLGPPQLTTFTTPVPPPRRAGPARVLVAALPPEDVRELGPVRVTCVARTVVDCARRLAPRDALAIADAALHRGLTDLTALARVLERQRGWPNVACARRVLELADGRRETPFESWSAWAFAVHDVPPPVWQVTITDAEGVFLGRVDGWWHAGIAGEADGALKYRLAAAERGGATADTLAAIADDERRRERGLHRAGVVVVRWSAADVLDPRRAAALAATLRRELAHVDGSRFTGRALVL